MSAEPRRRPVQARSRALVAAIMAGAARVLSRGTLAETSTNEIAETAGVSIGSLYQYFRNKQALVTALVRARAEADVDAMTTFLDVPRDMPLDDAVHRAAKELVALHRKSPHLYAVLLRAVPELGQHAFVRALAARGRARLRDFFVERRDDLRDLDPELAAFVAGHAIESIMHATILERPELLDDPRLERELARLLLGYVARGPSGPSSARRDPHRRDRSRP